MELGAESSVPKPSPLGKVPPQGAEEGGAAIEFQHTTQHTPNFP